MDIRLQLIIHVLYKYEQTLSPHEQVVFAAEAVGNKTEIWRNLIEKIKQEIGDIRLTAGSMATYFSLLKKGDFSIFTARSKFDKKFLKYCVGHEDWEQYKKTEFEVPQKDVERLMQIFELESPQQLKKIEKVSPIEQYLVGVSELENLEFGVNDFSVEINCITDSLSWASEFLPKKADSIIAGKNVFRYILTSELHPINISNIEELLKKRPLLKEKVLVRSLYNSKKLKFREIAKMVFPLACDVVIYRIKTSLDSEYNYHFAIVGANINENDTLMNFSFKIPKGKGALIFDWFSECWELISCPFESPLLKNPKKPNKRARKISHVSKK